MQEIVFATGNRNKVNEILEAIGDRYTILTPEDLGISGEIEENATTLEGNASAKSKYIYGKTGRDCFGDDTGLEVEALGGAPGIYSARYAGEKKDSEANMNKLLKNLEGKTDRRARFRTVISLVMDGKEHLFEGVLNGHITESRRGTSGFGYDPIFIPEGYDRTLAEMTLHEKNSISHRGMAVKKLAEFLMKNGK